jgi:hypothetical protein
MPSAIPWTKHHLPQCGRSRTGYANPSPFDSPCDNAARNGLSARATTQNHLPTPCLAEFCIPKTLCNILRKDAIFQKIEFRCQEIADVRDIAES